MEIYALRHAQSTAQIGGPDWLDPDLSGLGEDQAEACREYFCEITFDLALVSPLTRARRTFELARPHATVARFDSRLVECTLNRGPGYDYREILPYSTPDSADADAADMWTQPAGQRVANLLAELRSLDVRKVLLVAHNGILNVIRSHFVGTPILDEPGYDFVLSGDYTDNTGLARFLLGATPGEDRLISWNEETSPLTRV